MIFCEQCCDSKNFKKIVENYGNSDSRRCIRCQSEKASFKIEVQELINAVAEIAQRKFEIVKNPEESRLFGHLEKEQAELYRQIVEDVEEREENEEFWDDSEVPKETANIENYVQETYGVNWTEVVYQETNSPFVLADDIFNEILQLPGTCRNDFFRELKKYDIDYGRFHHALTHPAVVLYWKRKNKQESIDNNITWEEFVYLVKEKNRFFPESNPRIKLILDNFGKIIEVMRNHLSGGSIVFRARVAKSEQDERDISSYPSKELNSAPKNFAAYNRFSPAGISYAYASFDKDTAVQEIRPDEGDVVYIGQFELQDKKYVDFSKEMFDYYSDDLHPFYKDIISQNQDFVYKFIENITQPVSNDHQKIEYVPTQILSEFIKINGFDGIIFDSSITGKKNIVHFGSFIEYKDFERLQIIKINKEIRGHNTD